MNNDRVRAGSQGGTSKIVHANRLRDTADERNAVCR